jgi:hypothetical protein
MNPLKICTYQRTTLTNENYIRQEMRIRLNLGNACYNSVQNLLSSCLQSQNFRNKIYRTTTLPVVFYGCETWSVSDSRVLRTFGPKRDEIIEGWRKLHNEELHNLYSSPNIRMIKSRMIRWAGHAAHMGEK